MPSPNRRLASQPTPYLYSRSSTAPSPFPPRIRHTPSFAARVPRLIYLKINSHQLLPISLWMTTSFPSTRSPLLRRLFKPTLLYTSIPSWQTCQYQTQLSPRAPMTLSCVLFDPLKFAPLSSHLMDVPYHLSNLRALSARHLGLSPGRLISLRHPCPWCLLVFLPLRLRARPHPLSTCHWTKDTTFSLGIRASST